MNYKDSLKKKVQVITKYEDDIEFAKEIGLTPGDVSISITAQDIAQLLEDIIEDKLQSTYIPLLPTLEKVEDVSDIVKLAEKANIKVSPEKVSVQIECYFNDDDATFDTILTMTPYHNVKALVLFGTLSDGITYCADDCYSVGAFDSDAITGFVGEWLAKQLGIQLSEDTSALEFVAAVLSKIYNTDVAFNGFSEVEDTEEENGKCLMLDCFEFKLSQTAFEDTQD